MLFHLVQAILPLHCTLSLLLHEENEREVHTMKGISLIRVISVSWRRLIFILFRALTDKTIFGVPLSVTVQRSGEALPRSILQALHMLRQSALDQIGLFRKSGVRSRIGKLKEMCQQCGPNETIDFSEQQPYDVADMVKQYFRELPEALLTNKLSETFVTIFQGE